MTKCPFCAEEIKSEAAKCKHCHSILDPKTKKDHHPKKTSSFSTRDKFVIKGIWKSIQVVLILSIWPIGIPAVVTWYIWKKAKLTKKQKLGWTFLPLILMLLLINSFMELLKTPTIKIFEPFNNSSFQAETTLVKGFVEPNDAELNINDTSVELSNGEFSYLAQLTDEENIFNFDAINSNGITELKLIINRTFSEEEIAEYQAQKAEKEAKKLAELEERKKAEEEMEAKLEAERKVWERSKAGQLCAKYPSWSDFECEKVADQKYWIGMTYNMLIESHRSKPNTANPSNYGGKTQWQWCWTYRTPSCFYDDNDDGIIDAYN